jgi:hypothetical protein
MHLMVAFNISQERYIGEELSRAESVKLADAMERDQAGHLAPGESSH